MKEKTTIETGKKSGLITHIKHIISRWQCSDQVWIKIQKIFLSGKTSVKLYFALH